MTTNDERRTDPQPMRRVAIGWNDDYGAHYAYAASADQVHDPEVEYVVDVPAELVERMEAADAAATAAQRAVVVAAGVDPDSDSLVSLTICPQWRGETWEFPGSWAIAYPPSGDPDVWPATGRPHFLAGFPTEAEATAVLAALPDRFVLDSSLRNVYDKARLFVHHHVRDTTYSRCLDCGHSRLAHAQADGHELGVLVTAIDDDPDGAS